MARSVLITGCSSGIGRDAARTLKSRGWRVFATCRRPEDCAGLIAEGLESFPLDYESEESVAEGAREALDRTGGTLDALFNNGAWGLPAAVEDLPRDGLRAIFEANVFGWLDLTNRVIPAMRAQGHGRIVMNSSVLGFVPLTWRGAYVATKHAIEGLTDTLRIEMRDTSIRVSLIEPGPVTTMIRRKSIPNFERWIDWRTSSRAADYEADLMKRLYGNPDRARFELPPSAVSGKLIHALEAERPRPRYHVTTPTYLMGALKRILPTRALDWVIAKG